MSEIIGIDKAQEEARRSAGVLLPNIDPTIGEMLLTTIYANPSADLAEIVLGLIRGAPSNEVAKELCQAMIELVTCKAHGDLKWLHLEGHAILIGIREAKAEQSLMFGGIKWPAMALMSGPPKLATIRIGSAMRGVWLACEGLQGAIMRQSEVVALGNLMVESFGAKVIEDRMGPEVMRQSMIEGNMSRRAKSRAVARGAADKLTIDAFKKADPKAGHARVAIAEAFPGLLNVGDEIVPEIRIDGLPPAEVVEAVKTGMTFVVERRVSESWVVAVAIDPQGRAPAGAWEYRDGRKPLGMEDSDGTVGFSEEPVGPVLVAPPLDTEPEEPASDDGA
jgi:hypothetical protein